MFRLVNKFNILCSIKKFRLSHICLRIYGKRHLQVLVCIMQYMNIYSNTIHVMLLCINKTMSILSIAPWAIVQSSNKHKHITSYKQQQNSIIMFGFQNWFSAREHSLKTHQRQVELLNLFMCAICNETRFALLLLQVFFIFIFPFVLTKTRNK